jgi:type II secretory pathway pseudopilin PulG
MVMLVILVVGGAAFLVSSLSTTALKTARQEKAAEALAQAKEALIGYAAGDENRPGELPCPDINNDGVVTISGPAADYSGSNCISLIGRLPWKTLGLPDLRDENLWYAVSDPFHANSAAVLNSDTAGTLTVTGNVSASNVIAIVFAPGQSLSGQDRSAANINTFSAYLESVVTAPTSFSLLTPDNQPGGNYSYNDQLMLITHDTLFPLVEKIVAKRVRNELFNTSRPFWSPYPPAATFADPAIPSSFISTSGMHYGLLPRFAVWSGLPTFSTVGGSATCTPSQLAGSPSLLAKARLRCDISGITGTPTFTISGVLTPSLGLWRQYDLTSPNEVRIKVRGTCAAPNPSSGTTANCSITGSGQATGVNATISYTTNSDGSVTVTLSGTLIDAMTRIEWRDVFANTAYDWFTQNEWHKVIYYAVSPGYVAPNSACEPLGTLPHILPYCLTLSGSGSNIRAAIIMMGGALTGQSRAAGPLALCAATGTNIAPSACLSNYLELENATPADFVYENRTRSSTFNDQATIVAP